MRTSAGVFEFCRTTGSKHVVNTCNFKPAILSTPCCSIAQPDKVTVSALGDHYKSVAAVHIHAFTRETHTTLT
jgi:hypothetical protein